MKNVIALLVKLVEDAVPVFGNQLNDHFVAVDNCKCERK